MPASYIVDVDRELMVTTLKGLVSRDELLAFVEDQIVDPRTARVTRHLVDCRELTEMTLTLEDLPGLGETVRQNQVARRGDLIMRTALVVASTLDAEASRLLNALVSAVGQASFFFNVDHAYHWLGLDPPGPRPRPPRATEEGRG